MDLPRFSTKQLLISVTWMCVGFAGIAFSFRAWNLPLSPSYDSLANLEPFVRAASLVVGWVIFCAAAICLVTRRRRGAVLIAALISMIPGAIVGFLIGDTLWGRGRAADVACFGGAVLACLLVILGAIIPPKTIELPRTDADPESHRDGQR